MGRLRRVGPSVLGRLERRSPCSSCAVGRCGQGGAGGLGGRRELTPGCLVQLLLDHQDAIAPEHNDPIHELLDDLGEVPTIESLIGAFGPARPQEGP